MEESNSDHGLVAPLGDIADIKTMELLVSHFVSDLCVIVCYHPNT